MAEGIVKTTQATWDKIKESADHYARTERLGEGGAPPYFPSEPTKIRNDSGGNRRAGEILGLGDSILTELSNEYLWFSGVAPSFCAPFGVLYRPLPSGAIDTIRVSGACRALVNITDLCHRWATVELGSYVLQSSETGPVRLLWTPGIEGEQVCLAAFSWEKEAACPVCGSSSAGSSSASESSESGSSESSESASSESASSESSESASSEGSESGESSSGEPCDGPMCMEVLVDVNVSCAGGNIIVTKTYETFCGDFCKQ